MLCFVLSVAVLFSSETERLISPMVFPVERVVMGLCCMYLFFNECQDHC